MATAAFAAKSCQTALTWCGPRPSSIPLGVETVTALHAIDLPAPSGGAAPDWVHLTPAGTFRGADGRGPYTIDPAAVIAASTCPMVLDENHSTDLALTSGGSSPARGWITELAARPDGLWGRVDWTPSGRTLVGERAYRGISPAIASERGSGRVVRVLRASLTNLPNFDLTTLHNRQEFSHMDLASLRAALGLAAEASLDDCVAAATRQREAVTTHAAQLGRIARAAGAAENADAAAIETALGTVRTGADAEARRLAAEVVTLNTRLGELQTAQARGRAEAAIDAALAAGKPITALREHYISRHMQDAASVDRELAAMPSLHAGGLGGRAMPAAADGLTQQDRDVATRLGLKPEQLKAEREKREALRQGA